MSGHGNAIEAAGSPAFSDERGRAAPGGPKSLPTGIQPPAVELFDALPPAIEADLRASIKRFGVIVPVVQDQDGRVLDGAHRARIAGEQGIGYEVTTVRVTSEDEAREIARTLNADRRQLTAEQRQAAAANRRAEGRSYRAIAAELGVSEGTARADVRAVELRSDTQLSPERVVGLDGKSRPASHSGFPGRIFSGDMEWFTPPEISQAARQVMGAIDLDPASTAAANDRVGATTFYNREEDGLTLPWYGRVWLNPPFARGLIGRFCEKVRDEYRAGHITETCVLTDSATETRWFQGLAKDASAICFPAGRLKFWHPAKGKNSPLFGQAITYFGPNIDAFCRVFGCFGVTFPLPVQAGRAAA